MKADIICPAKAEATTPSLSNRPDWRYRKGSRQLRADVDAVSYPGQKPQFKQVVEGFENFMDFLPCISPEDENPAEKIKVTQEMMAAMSATIKNETWPFQNQPEATKFDRTIIAMESPDKTTDPFTEGVEVVIARWGDGHTSPVHGHAPGYMHEEIISGKMRVNTYRIVSEELRTARPLKTEIIKDGVFVSGYVKPTDVNKDFRNVLVHNFTSIGNSVSMHYLPEHTRDGRDNRFEVEHFAEFHSLNVTNVERIDSRQGMYLQKGDVVLVRSTNVPEYGDHYIVVTGPPVQKEHGFRIQDEAIIASKSATELLDKYELQTGLTLLKLKEPMKQAFHAFHNITFDELGNVLFPAA